MVVTQTEGYEAMELPLGHQTMAARKTGCVLKIHMFRGFRLVPLGSYL